MIALPASARLYLRPVQFVDTPIGRDGEVARLAGGMQWFAGYELVAVDAGARVAQRTIGVADLPALIERLPAAQAERLRLLENRIAAPHAPIRAGERVLRLDQPLVMGILNVTPDSFSDGGTHHGDPAAAAAAGVVMAEKGAAIIDPVMAAYAREIDAEAILNKINALTA